MKPRLFAMIPALGASVTLASLACQLPTESATSGTCVAMTNVDGVLFGSYPDRFQTSYQAGPVVATVTRARGCEDMGPGPVAPLAPGESNSLETGTQLCSVVGFPTTKRLMVCDPEIPWPVTLTSE